MKYSKTLGSVALSGLLMLGLVGCGGSDSVAAAEAAAEEVITPYTRVAVIEGKDWSDVKAIAEKIAKYVVFTDESNITTNGVMELPTNWVIAGANGGAYGISGPEEWDTDGSDLLPIPAMGVPSDTTDPTLKKSRVIEFCNKAYATEAVGTGKFHGSALPCEVSVHSDGTNVYVDMLDAEAIFNIFFTDAKDNFSDEENLAFAEMAAEVKSELRTMINAGLADSNGVSGSASIAYTEVYDELGPQFTQEKIDNEIALRNPYIIYQYERKEEGGTFSLADANTLAEEIIEKLGTDAATADTHVPGVSKDSAWRSGRKDPIAIPNVKVVEACSPKYAKKATALGNEYITALPCEFTIYVDETAEGYDTVTKTGPVLAISFLNPNFMFGTMFEGAVQNAYDDARLTKDEVIEYSTLADVVFGDLRLIVDAAVQDSELDLTIPHSED